MKVTVLSLVASLTSFLIAGPVVAGSKQSNPVSVSQSGRVATGALGAGRNSTDGVQYIGCGVTAGASGAWTAFCFAQPPVGAGAFCVSTVPGIVQTVLSMSGDSNIYFNWDATQTCVSVYVENMSFWEPKR